MKTLVIEIPEANEMTRDSMALLSSATIGHAIARLGLGPGEGRTIIAGNRAKWCWKEEPVSEPTKDEGLMARMARVEAALGLK